MQIELVDINQIVPYAQNPRINQSAIAKVADSIKEFGFRQPIVVDSNMVIIAGHTRHVILDKKTYEHDLKDFSFTFIELPKFKKDNIAELSGILEKWCFFFKYADETTEAELEEIIGSDLVIKRAYSAIDHFNWSEDELNAYDAELKRIRDNIATLDFQYDKGKAEGKEEGREERDNEIAKNLLSQGVDLEIIKQATGLTEQQIIKLKKY